MEFIRDMFSYLVIIAIIVLIRIYVLSTVEVVGDSMNPGLYDGNVLLVDQISDNFTEYHRFQVVILEYESPSYLVKRIIGLPGDKVEYKDNELYINDKQVAEKFKIKGETDDFALTEIGHETIPDDMYFVLGDNREKSLDSRAIGLVPKDEIIGKPFINIWPLNRIHFVK